MELAGYVLTTAWASALDLAPVVAVLLVFQLKVLRRPLPKPRRIGLAMVYVFVGMTLFLVGLHEALFPIGRTMALQLAEASAQASGEGAADWRDYLWVYVFAPAIASASALAEPALIAVALKAQEASGGAIPALGLRLAVAIGVGVGVALGTFRIVTGLPLPYFILAGYAIVMAQTCTSPRGSCHSPTTPAASAPRPSPCRWLPPSGSALPRPCPAAAPSSTVSD